MTIEELAYGNFSSECKHEYWDRTFLKNHTCAQQCRQCGYTKRDDGKSALREMIGEKKRRRPA